MKIELKYPFNKKWKVGYLNIKKDGRKILSLYNSHDDRTSVQYCRYLMSVKLKRFLTENEQVDHIDGNHTNDDLNNLQILTQAEHNIKTHKKPDIHIICPMCKKSFKRTRTQLRGRLKKALKNEICCSSSCGAKYGHLKKGV